jgi:hypothetical protein
MSGSLAGLLLTALTKMSNNGHSPTAQTIDDFTIDINRVSRIEFNAFMRLVNSETDEAKLDQATGEFAEKVITAWPFEQEITQANYVKMGVIDMQRVDDALLQAVAVVLKKKSSLLLTPPENSNGALPQSSTMAQTLPALQNTNMSG